MRKEIPMRKLLCLLMILALLPLTASAAVKMSLTPGERCVEYAFTAPDEWVRLTWKSRNVSGGVTLYGPGGEFAGALALPFSGEGGKYTITVQNLKLQKLAEQSVTLPQAADYTVPAGKSNGKVSNMTLEETPAGFRYAFDVPDTDYVMLYFRSVQENAVFPVFPVDEKGHYAGEVKTDITFSRDLFTVQVRNAAGNSRREGEVRKGYEAPPAPEARPGRLSGVTVCIDPGHHENHRPFKEDKGPGLTGFTHNSGGMGQGRKTLRKESSVVLETGMILRDLLIAEGAAVVMTREKPDDFRTNRDRCDIAEAGGAQILLRLHCNMNDNNNKTGIMIYGPLRSEYAQAVAHKDEYRLLGNLFLTEMKKATGFELTDKTGFVTLNDDYVGNNWAKMLCFLVEMGYMSNIGEDYKMAVPEYQTQLARGMVEGVYQVALRRGWITE